MQKLGSPQLVGTTPLQLGPIGLGTAALGNLYTPVPESEAQATLAMALSSGIRWFDVAPLYGCGLAEMRLGSFLQARRPASAIVSTKVGRLLKPASSPPAHHHFVAPLPYEPVFDYSRAGIQRSYDESLMRLGLDRVPLVLLHDIDRITHPTGHRELLKQVLDEALPQLHCFKAQGRVDAIGLGINEWDIGLEILRSTQIDCVLLAGRYTLLDATALSSGFLEACLRRGVSVLAGGVFNSGFLAGGAHYAYRPADEALLRKREQLLAICQRHRVELPAVAIQFTAAHPAVSSLVIGARLPSEVRSILDWSHTIIPEDVWAKLRAEGHIPSDAPLPRRAVETRLCG